LKQDYTHLYQVLGYCFQREDYLTIALTHRSAGTPNNERLEFLGDALLGYIIAKFLFDRFPVASEGELTRLRASLVKKDTLAEIAQQLELGQYLYFGGGELKSGGWRRSSILADALEAIIGAICLDSGMTICKEVVLRLFQERLSMLSPQRVIKDPKTRLQEYLQAKQQPLPEYRILAIEGAPHAQHFEVECVVPGLRQSALGEGNSRRRAEQAAAERALLYLNYDE